MTPRRLIRSLSAIPAVYLAALSALYVFQRAETQAALIRLIAEGFRYAYYENWNDRANEMPND